MVDFIVILILVVILGAAALYIYKSKKSGKRCVGCPDSGSCQSSGCGCGCGCGGDENSCSCHSDK